MTGAPPSRTRAGHRLVLTSALLACGAFVPVGGSVGPGVRRDADEAWRLVLGREDVRFLGPVAFPEAWLRGLRASR